VHAPERKARMPEQYALIYIKGARDGKGYWKMHSIPPRVWSTPSSPPPERPSLGGLSFLAGRSPASRRACSNTESLGLLTFHWLPDILRRQVRFSNSRIAEARLGICFPKRRVSMARSSVCDGMIRRRPALLSSRRAAEQPASSVIASACEAIMRCQSPISEEHSEAIRAAIGEGLRVLHALAGRQRVPRDIRRSLDRLEEIEREIDAPVTVGSSKRRGWLARLMSIASSGKMSAE
jgi:hypothetical protein